MTQTPLTPRETEVLRLVAQGCGNEEIGRRLGIGTHTVKNHMTTAMRRLGAKDRAHACSLLDDLSPGWRPSLIDGDTWLPSLAFRLRMFAAEVDALVPPSPETVPIG